MHDSNISNNLREWNLHNLKVMHPTSLLVQLPEGCKDYFINVEVAKAAIYPRGTLPSNSHRWNQLPGSSEVDKGSKTT